MELRTLASIESNRHHKHTDPISHHFIEGGQAIDLILCRLDRFHRANLDTVATAGAARRVDNVHILAFGDALDRTLYLAGPARDAHVGIDAVDFVPTFGPAALRLGLDSRRECDFAPGRVVCRLVPARLRPRLAPDGLR